MIIITNQSWLGLLNFNGGNVATAPWHLDKKAKAAKLSLILYGKVVRGERP